MVGICSRHLLFPENAGVLFRCTSFCANLTVLFEAACTVKNKLQSCPVGIDSHCFQQDLNAQADAFSAHAEVEMALERQCSRPRIVLIK